MCVQHGKQTFHADGCIVVCWVVGPSPPPSPSGMLIPSPVKETMPNMKDNAEVRNAGVLEKEAAVANLPTKVFVKITGKRAATVLQHVGAREVLGED